MGTALWLYVSVSGKPCCRSRPKTIYDICHIVPHVCGFMVGPDNGAYCSLRKRAARGRPLELIQDLARHVVTASLLQEMLKVARYGSGDLPSE